MILSAEVAFIDPVPLKGVVSFTAMLSGQVAFPEPDMLIAQVSLSDLLSGIVDVTDALKGEVVFPPVIASAVLLESSSVLLLEDGNHLLLESNT